MSVRHGFLKDQPVDTRYGRAHLDSKGVVANLKKLSCNEEELLSVPGFVPTDETPEDIKIEEAPEPPVVETMPTPQPSDYFEVIRELKEAGAPVNSEGYIEMAFLNAHLREENLPLLTGTQRKDIEDAFAPIPEEDEEVPVGDPQAPDEEDPVKEQ